MIVRAVCLCASPTFDGHQDVEVGPTVNVVPFQPVDVPPERFVHPKWSVEEFPLPLHRAGLMELHANALQHGGVFVCILDKDQKRDLLARLQAMRCVGDQLGLGLLQETQKIPEPVVSFRIKQEGERPEDVVLLDQGRASGECAQGESPFPEEPDDEWNVGMDERCSCIIVVEQEDRPISCPEGDSVH